MSLHRRGIPMGRRQNFVASDPQTAESLAEARECGRLIIHTLRCSYEVDAELINALDQLHARFIHLHEEEMTRLHREVKATDNDDDDDDDDSCVPL